MPLLVVSVALALCLFARGLFLAYHARDFDSLWYDLERGGAWFQLARALSVITFLAFLGCAAWMLWTLDAQATSGWVRYGTIFVTWWGMSLLERFGVHRFPRTNQPDLYRDAVATLAANLIVSLAAGLTVTGGTALYDWLRR